MLDGFKATVILKIEKLPPQISFFSQIEVETGLVKEGSSKKADFETYKLELFERKPSKEGFRLILTGSFHKNHQKGTNFQPFTYGSLNSEILQLCDSLNIAPEEIILQNLEIGLNLPVWFRPIEFLDSDLLVFQNSEFVKYVPDNQGISIGYVCKKTNYWIKIYDKGLQYNLPGNLLRFEIKIIKMRELEKYGIKTIADLADPSKVKPLISLLEKAWSDVLIYDIPEIPKNISPSQRRFLEDCRYKDYWFKLNKRSNQKFRDAKRRFKELSAKYGSGTHSKISELIRSEWEKKFENSTDFTGCKSEIESTVSTDFTNTVKGEIRGQSFLQTVDKRFCKTCGRDITDQRKGSKFCSETKYGREAKQCRNRDSNPRNNRKTWEIRFNRIGQPLFDLGPYLKVNYP